MVTLRLHQADWQDLLSLCVKTTVNKACKMFMVYVIMLETLKAIITEAANTRESDWFKHNLCIRCEDKFCSDLLNNTLL